MTDRDLFYCTDMWCDGHARSNDVCDPDKGEGFDAEAVTEDDEEVPPVAPTYTVSGNHMRVFRLDPEGNPIGEAIEFPGPVSFDIPEGTVSDATVLMDSEGFSSLTLTLDIEMGQVDPALIALLTGVGTPPEEMTLITLPTRWQRFKAWLRRCERWWFSMGSK